MVAVDLQPMAPLPGVVQICGDITLEKTAREVGMALLGEDDDGSSAAIEDPSSASSPISEDRSLTNGKKGAKADLIICDGAPDVTGLHALDASLQAQLLTSALTITFKLLSPGGTFVAKVFATPPQRSSATAPFAEKEGTTLGGKDMVLLMAQLRTRFDKVVLAKPPSSRPASAEHFIVATGFDADNEELDAFVSYGDLSAWNEAS
ncbi:SAM-dependent methyltransferase/cell division protein FtsJ [Ceraceosorus bombacis]|uniref:SAM-dependent methyltransferase/cell division protein FtsJ n=1 Tax=Ceraceosorus bombacis TaxID=401625 RepID=A0A0N7L9Q3_9BASI|nr:SAM-dependent methyltransferase/cell division protein FtsJ [Ceraceosorus bombacis]